MITGVEMPPASSFFQRMFVPFSGLNDVTSGGPPAVRFSCGPRQSGQSAAEAAQAARLAASRVTLRNSMVHLVSV